jgi:hypothetical protein
LRIPYNSIVINSAPRNSSPSTCYGAIAPNATGEYCSYVTAERPATTHLKEATTEQWFHFAFTVVAILCRRPAVLVAWRRSTQPLQVVL